MPVISRTGDVLGGLFLGHPEPGIFTERAERVAASIAGQAAIAIDNARLFEDTQKEIAARKRTEEQLRESEQRFRHMADHAPVMIWMTDPQGACVFLSKSWYEFTGQTAETGLGFGWLEAIHPAQRLYAQDAFVSANEKREPFQLEYRLRSKDGSYHWAIDAASPRFGTSGEFLGYIGSVINISERKKQEQALAESESRFRLLADGAPALIWINNLRGAEFVNRGYLEFLGVNPAQVQGYDWAQFIHPEDRDRYLKAYEQAVIQRCTFRAEFRFRRHDGIYRWMQSVAQPRISFDGQFLGYAGLSLDVTERKEVEDAGACQHF